MEDECFVVFMFDEILLNTNHARQGKGTIKMIKVEKLDKYFYKGKSNENHVLKEVTLEMDRKGLVCILGESGSGKTTLLNAIGGLDTFQSGTITIEDTVLKKYETQKIERLRNQKFGYIFQNYYLLEDYTVAYNIKLALNVFDLTEEEKDARVDYVLEALDMKKYKKKRVSQLSGGQQQRVSIARALVKSPEIILADEPTGNLDEENTLKIMSILKSISKECLVIVVSHEKNIAHFFADRIIEIQDGQIQKDYVNDASESYQKMDDANIYLKDMGVRKMEMEGMEVAVYQDKEDVGKEAIQTETDSVAPRAGVPESAQNEKIRLNLAWRDGKLYIQSPDDVTLVLAGEETGCMMLDASRPKLEQSQTDEISYDLPQVKAKKNATLPVREIWKLARENIQMMGKKRKFMIGILLATSVMLVLALADYMMQRSVDKQAVVTEDSHYVTVSLELSQSADESTVSRKAKEYIDKYVKNGNYKDAYIMASGTLSLVYDGFAQIREANARIKEYSVVSQRYLKQEDLVCGRMPENRREIVIDRWLVDRFRSSGEVLGEIYGNENILLSLEAKTMISNLRLKIVGISDTNEPSVYVNDNVALSMNYSDYYVMSDEDLKELYPGKYDDLELADDEILVTEPVYEAYEYQKEWYDGYESATDEAESTLDMKKCKIKGAFPVEAGASYVISQENCDRLRYRYMKETRKFKVYTDDVEGTITYFKSTGEDYTDIFTVNAESVYQEQLDEYQEEQKVNISAGYLVTLAVSILSLIIIYFTIKSNAMARSEELTVYRLIGISPGSIMKAYILEMILVTACTCIPAILVTSGIIKLIVSIPSLEIYLLFPWWLALALAVSLFVVNSIISILPVQGILRKPPAQLAAKS